MKKINNMDNVKKEIIIKKLLFKYLHLLKTHSDANEFMNIIDFESFQMNVAGIKIKNIKQFQSWLNARNKMYFDEWFEVEDIDLSHKDGQILAEIEVVQSATVWEEGKENSNDIEINMNLYLKVYELESENTGFISEIKVVENNKTIYF